MKILAISGSLRDASYNSKLLRAAQELAPHGVEVGLRDGRQVGARTHPRAPGASAVRADSQTVSYQGSTSRG